MLHPEYSRISLVETPKHLKILCEAAEVPEDLVFHSHPKPIEMLSPANEETAVHLIKKDGSSIPVVTNRRSIVSSFYDSKFLTFRIYSKDEFERNLLNAIKDIFQI